MDLSDVRLGCSEIGRLGRLISKKKWKFFKNRVTKPRGYEKDTKNARIGFVEWQIQVQLPRLPWQSYLNYNSYFAIAVMKYHCHDYRDNRVSFTI